MVIFLNKEIKKEDSIKKEELVSHKKKEPEKKMISIDDVINKHMGKKKALIVEKPKAEDLVKIVSPYKPIPLTGSSYFVFMKELDYNRLYSYLGKTKSTSVVSEVEIPEEAKSVVRSSNNVFSYGEISDYLKKFTVNNLVGAQMNNISIKERERFNMYAFFNRQQIVLGMINLGVVQTDIPAPPISTVYVAVKAEKA